MHNYLVVSQQHTLEDRTNGPIEELCIYDHKYLQKVFLMFLSNRFWKKSYDSKLKESNTLFL